jgi:predicted Zn-dependent protease
MFSRFLQVNRTQQAANPGQQIPTQPEQNPTPTAPAITPPNAPLPPQVMEAQKRADQNPNDPVAQLDLAIAYWNANLPKPGYDTLVKIPPLVPPEDREFYMQAGNRFRDQPDGWLPAASLYFFAMRAQPGGDIPNPVREAFHEALYKGANRPEFPLVVPADQVRPIDEPILLIAQARNAFLNGRIDEAVRHLMRARQLEDTLREADLLEGEMNALEGKKDLATRYLSSLAQDTSSTPEWIRLFAKQILDGMK